MKLTLAPIPFFWTHEKRMKYYEMICRTDVSVVYIGETVCIKRAYESFDELKEIFSMLKEAGKEVVFSSLYLIRSKVELDIARELARHAEELGICVEANNAAILKISAGNIIAGHSIPVYNAESAAFLSGFVRRIVFMPEISLECLSGIISALKTEKEIYFYGRMPLAVSWRCYTARYHGLENNNCGLVCKKHEDGINSASLSGEPLWNINGMQILSSKKVCPVKEIKAVEEMGITHLRIVPQTANMDEIIDILLQAVNKKIDGEKAFAELAKIDNLCSGWSYGKAGHL